MRGRITKKDNQETVFRNFSKRLRERKEMYIIYILFAVGICCVVAGAGNFYILCKEQKASVCLSGTVQGSFPMEKFSKMKQIRYAGRVEQTTVIVQSGEYSCEATLFGMEQGYLDLQYGQYIETDMNGSMPYVVMKEEIFPSLKNDDHHTLKLDSVENYLLQTIVLNGKQARICGIILQKKRDKEEKTDTEKLTDGQELPVESEIAIYTSIDAFYKLTDEAYFEEDNTDFAVKSPISQTALQAVKRLGEVTPEETEYLENEDVYAGEKSNTANVVRQYDGGEELSEASVYSKTAKEVNCYILTENGRGLKKVIEALQREEVMLEITQDLREMMHRQDCMKLKGIGFCLMGALLSLFSCFAFKTQCDHVYRQLLCEVEEQLPAGCEKKTITGKLLLHLFGYELVAGLILYMLCWVVWY